MQVLELLLPASEKLDFTLSSNSTFSHISNSLQTTLNSTYLNQNTRFKIQANPWKGLVFQTDLSHQYYQGLSASFKTFCFGMQPLLINL